MQTLLGFSRCWCHRFRWQTIALMLFVVNFIFIRCSWERASSPLSTSQCALCARWTTRCGCRRTYKSELNFIQLSLPVERARHSSVQQYNSPRGPIHCYLFIWFSTLDFVFATLLAAVCQRCHCRRRRFNAKLEIVSYNFMGITAISFFFLFRPYIYVISSCLILLSSKWIPCEIRIKKTKICFAPKKKMATTTWILRITVAVEKLNLHRILSVTFGCSPVVWIVRVVSHRIRSVPNKKKKKTNAKRMILPKETKRGLIRILIDRFVLCWDRHGCCLARHYRFLRLQVDEKETKILWVYARHR